MTKYPSVFAVIVLAAGVLSCAHEGKGASQEPHLPPSTPPSRVASPAAATAKPAPKKAPQSVTMFLDAFEAAVSRKDPAALLRFMDMDYRKSQHEGMLKGDTPRFIDELLCGNLAHRKGFGCVKLQQITSFKRVYVRKQGAGYEVEYIVISASKSVVCTWHVRVRESRGTRQYGLVGALG